MTDQATIKIADRIVGSGAPCYVVAELSGNHNQDLSEAVRLVQAAKDAGADAVKLQTYTPDTLTINCDREYFRIGKGTLWEGRTLYDLYREASTPWEWQPRLKSLADEIGIHLFSTPFDFAAVDFLEEMNVPAHKIASFEVADLSLIERVARTAKPLMISTGMATVDEIGEALAAARGAGAMQIALLKCTSAYPAPPEEMNLRTIPDMAERFGVPVGLSDHTLGIAVPVAAVTLGACVVEKHLTLSRSTPGPDSAFSVEPKEFKNMVDAIRVAERAMGKVCYEVTEREAASRVFRRSLFIVKNVQAGETLTRENVRSIRPGHGLPPKFYDLILGAKATRALVRGTPLTWDSVCVTQPIGAKGPGARRAEHE